MKSIFIQLRIKVGRTPRHISQRKQAEKHFIKYDPICLLLKPCLICTCMCHTVIHVKIGKLLTVVTLERLLLKNLHILFLLYELLNPFECLQAYTLNICDKSKNATTH